MSTSACGCQGRFKCAYHEGYADGADSILDQLTTRLALAESVCEAADLVRIANAPADLAYLLTELASLRAERDEYLRMLCADARPVRHTNYNTGEPCDCPLAQK